MKRRDYLKIAGFFAITLAPGVAVTPTSAQLWHSRCVHRAGRSRLRGERPGQITHPDSRQPDIGYGNPEMRQPEMCGCLILPAY